MNINELEEIFRDYKAKTNNISTMRVFNQVKSLIEDRPLTEEIFYEIFSNESSLCFLFTTPGKGASSSRLAIKNTKDVLIYIIQVFITNKIMTTITGEKIIEKIKQITLTNVLSLTLTITYFKSLDDVINFINKIGEAKFAQHCLRYKYATPYDEIRDLLDIKTIAILAWYGISIESMADFKINDLQTIYSQYNIEERWQKIIDSYSKTTSLRTLNSAAKWNLDNNDYLFRGKLSVHYSTKQISAEINNFNDTCIYLGSPQLLSISDLKTNGVFTKIYSESRGKKEVAKKLIISKKYFINERYNYLEKYNVWVDKYYPPRKKIK